MKTIQFKTNLKCSGCVVNVSPGLNKTVGEQNWKVDIQSPDKILTVSAGGINESDIHAAFDKAGYKVKKIG